MVKKKNIQPFHEYLAEKIEASEHSQKEIAKRLGYSKPNIITMFKQGLTKVPLDKIGVLAETLNDDPIYLMNYAMNEYSPGLWDSIQDVLGFATTDNERKMIEIIRANSKGNDPHIGSTECEKKLKEFAKSLTA